MGTESYTGLPLSMEERDREWADRPGWQKNLATLALFLAIFGLPFLCGLLWR
jgi:hypothetical protein